MPLTISHVSSGPRHCHLTLGSVSSAPLAVGLVPTQHSVASTPVVAVNRRRRASHTVVSLSHHVGIVDDGAGATTEHPDTSPDVARADPGCVTATDDRSHSPNSSARTRCSPGRAIDGRSDADNARDGAGITPTRPRTFSGTVRYPPHHFTRYNARYHTRYHLRYHARYARYHARYHPRYHPRYHTRYHTLPRTLPPIRPPGSIRRRASASAVSVHRRRVAIWRPAAISVTSHHPSPRSSLHRGARGPILPPR